MKRRKAKRLDCVAWIAVSDVGYPAYFIGYARTRRELKNDYSLLFGADVEVHGYRLVKVRIRESGRRS